MERVDPSLRAKIEKWQTFLNYNLRNDNLMKITNSRLKTQDIQKSKFNLQNSFIAIFRVKPSFQPKNINSI
jgi:hypothetical protein